MEDKTVNKQFKILYAVGIFIVVAGHYMNGGVDLLFDWFKPYAFHVALFVFCAGYFYKNEDENSAGNFVFRRVKRLIYPLYAWNIFYGLLVLFLNQVGCKFPVEFSLYNLLIAPINDGHQFIFNLSSWFLVPLFMIQVFTVITRKILKKMGLNNEIVIFGFYMIIGMLGAQLAVEGYYTGWWLVISRFCYLLPFYACGFLYKTVLEKKIDKVSSTLYFSVVFFLQTVIIILYRRAFAYTPSKCDNFDNCIVPFLIGFIGIAFWVRVAKLLVPVIGDSKVMRLVADNTFSIMMHHLLGLFLLKGFFAFIRYGEIACRSFELELFRTEPLYIYIPFGIYPFAVFMVLGSMVFSIYFDKIPQFVIRKLKSIIGRNNVEE